MLVGDAQERDRAVPKDPAGSNIVKMRGMPYNATLANVQVCLKSNALRDFLRTRDTHPHRITIGL
jgi:hypothetical protein